MKIHQFDPVIYPILLWVIDGMDIEGIRKEFRTINNDEPLIFIPSEGGTAYTQNRVICKDGEYGCLIVLVNKSRITAGMMAHEATHAARVIWDHLMEENTGSEADAYLVQWIVNCIEIVIKDDDDDDDNKQ